MMITTLIIVLRDQGADARERKKRKKVKKGLADSFQSLLALVCSDIFSYNIVEQENENKSHSHDLWRKEK